MWELEFLGNILCMLVTSFFSRSQSVTLRHHVVNFTTALNLPGIGNERKLGSTRSNNLFLCQTPSASFNTVQRVVNFVCSIDRKVQLKISYWQNYYRKINGSFNARLMLRKVKTCGLNYTDINRWWEGIYFSWMPTDCLPRVWVHNEQVWTSRGSGVHIQWGPSWTSLNMSRGYCTVGRGQCSIQEPHSGQTDRQVHNHYLPATSVSGNNLAVYLGVEP